MARIYIGKNYEKQASPVQSIYRLAGSGEDALTYALGYLLAHDPEFCKTVLSRLEIAPWKNFASDYSVRLQEVTARGYGRRDIVIEGSEARIVIEAKIGDAEPAVEQILKYGDEGALWREYSVRTIVALTQGEMSESTCGEVRSKLTKKEIGFKNLQWHHVVELVLKYRPSSDVSRFLFGQFIAFIRSDYRMDYFDAEILIQDVNRLNAGIFMNGWMYVTKPSDKKAPLYFAPYFTRELADNGLSMISRVRDTAVVKLAEVEDCEDVASAPTNKHREKWGQGLQMLRERAEKEGFVDGYTRLLFLDEPIKFRSTPLTKKAFSKTNPPKKIPSQIPKGFSMGFDELLRAPS